MAQTPINGIPEAADWSIDGYEYLGMDRKNPPIVRWSRPQDPSDPPNCGVIEIIEDRMRRYFAGEDIGPTSGITYGDVVQPRTPEEEQRIIDQVNAARGVAK